MSKYFKYILTIALISIISCSKTIETSTTTDFESDMIIPIDDALTNLQQTINRIYGETKASSLSFDVEIVGNAELNTSTKSAEFNLPDTLLYLVNFNNNNGFAVLSANRELNEDIYCITESGSITKEELALALNLISVFKSQQLPEENEKEEPFKEIGRLMVSDIIMSAMLSDLNDNETYTKAETKGVFSKSDNAYGPWLQTKWKQTEPFNNLTDETSSIDDDWPCGCITIAVAQIINYHKRPVYPTFNNVACNWDTLSSVYHYLDPDYAGSSEAQRQAANFLYELGTSDYCNISYSALQGSADMLDAKRAFKKIGYSNLTRRIGCTNNDLNRIIDHVKNRKPVIMGGRVDSSVGDYGHAWVVDGVDGDYLHINWGWNGDCDGYFKKGNFNTKDFQMDPDTDSDGYPNHRHEFTRTYRYITYSL